jgi:multidrug efflux pump subunit AcrA (membrane-fusion protein)
MRGKWLLTGGVIAVVAACLGGWFWWQARADNPAPPPSRQTALPPGAELQLQGVIRAKNVIDIQSPADGVVEEVVVQPGDEVFEGQILARIRNENLQQAERDARADYEAAQSRVNAFESSLLAARLEESRAAANSSRARSDLDRAARTQQRQQLLWREGATPRRQYEAAEKELASARTESSALDALAAQIEARIAKVNSDLESAKKTMAEKEEELERAKADLEGAVIHSPADGVVTAVARSAGAEVKKNAETLLQLSPDLSALEIVLEPSPEILPRIRAGLPVLIRMAELPGEGLTATVREVAGEKAVIEFSSPSPLIRPGMTALVVVKLS